MPIRSPKGRGAAYRTLWQWPLRSPARLIGCLVVLILLGLGLNSAFGLLNVPSHGRPGIFAGDGSTAPAATPTAQAAPPAEATRLPPVPELTPETLAAVPGAARRRSPPPPGGTEAWARHPAGATAQTLGERAAPYTTDEYLGVLSTVDPANVPASRVTGPPARCWCRRLGPRRVPTDAVDLVGWW